MLRATRNCTERRKSVRYPLSVRAIFTWEKPEGVLGKGEGITRDVGVKGAFVFSATLPPVNTVIKLELVFPRPFRRPNALVAKMWTQRVERDLSAAASRGFSVIGTGFALRPASELVAQKRNRRS